MIQFPDQGMNSLFKSLFRKIHKPFLSRFSLARRKLFDIFLFLSKCRFHVFQEVTEIRERHFEFRNNPVDIASLAQEAGEMFFELSFLLKSENLVEFQRLP